jgi:hypothetical protein
MNARHQIPQFSTSGILGQCFPIPPLSAHTEDCMVMPQLPPAYTVKAPSGTIEGAEASIWVRQDLRPSQWNTIASLTPWVPQQYTALVMLFRCMLGLAAIVVIWGVVRWHRRVAYMKPPRTPRLRF